MFRLILQCIITLAIMGGVDIRRDVKQDAYAGEPYIVVEGVILMGGVDVKVRK